MVKAFPHLFMAEGGKAMKPIITTSIPVYPGTQRIEGQFSAGTNRLNQPYRDKRYRREYSPEGITIISDNLYEKLDKEYSDILAELLKDFDYKKHVIDRGGRHACYPLENGNRISFLRFDRFFIGSQGMRFVSSGLGQEQFFTYVEEKDEPDFSIPDHEALRQMVFNNEEALNSFLKEAFINCGALNFNRLFRYDRTAMILPHTAKNASEIAKGDCLNIAGCYPGYVEETRIIGEYILVFLWGADGSRLIAYKEGQKVSLRDKVFMADEIPAASLRKGMAIETGRSAVVVHDIVRKSGTEPFIHVMDRYGKTALILLDNSVVKVIGYEPIEPDGSTFEGIREGMTLHWRDKDTEVLAVFKSDTDRLCHLILKDTVTQKIGYRMISYDADMSFCK